MEFVGFEKLFNFNNDFDYCIFWIKIINFKQNLYKSKQRLSNVDCVNVNFLYKLFYFYFSNVQIYNDEMFSLPILEKARQKQTKNYLHWPYNFDQ